VAFIDIPAEQTTALTDAVLALVALYGVIALQRLGPRDPAKVRIWSWAFGILAFSAALGGVVHGFRMPPGLKERLWVPLYLTLGLTVSLFPVAAVHDLWGVRAVRKALIIMISMAAAFFALARWIPGGFLIFVLYSAAIMIFMVGAYGGLAMKGKVKGAWHLTAGFVISLIAGAIQAKRGILVTLIWTFDHNGIYHILLTAGLAIIIAGLRKGEKA
jgi:hypothetical protein